MTKWILIFVAGVVLGAVAVLLLMRDEVDGEPVRAPATDEASPPAVFREVDRGSRAVSLRDIQELPSHFERLAALYDLLGSADLKTVENLVEDADALPGFSEFLTSAVYSRYVQLAPRAAVERLLAEGRERSFVFISAVAGWASDDLDAAMGFVETLEPSLRSSTVLYVLNQGEGLSESEKEQIAQRFSMEPHLSQMRATTEAKTDPASAWRNALAMPKGEKRTRALWGIAYTWFHEDPAAALSALDSLADKNERDRWRGSLLGRWAAADREAAWNWARAQPESANPANLMAAVAGAVAAESPREMLQIADTLDPDERREVAGRVLRVWGRADPEAVLSALEDMDDRELTEAVRGSVINSWGRSDPRAALDWVLAQPPSAGRSSLLSAALSAYASADAESALAFAASLDGEDRSQAIRVVIPEWAREDPRAAAAWLDASQHRTADNVSAVAYPYARLDPEAAFNWLMDQPRAARQRGVWSVIREVAARSPESAPRLIDRIEDSSTKEIAWSALIRAWVEKDPRAAVRAIGRMDDELSPSLYQSAFQSWSGFDRDGATAFLGRVPASRRDWAIQGILTQALYSENTELAERMYRRLAGEEARRESARGIYYHLRRTHPERAERFRKDFGIEIDEDGRIREP